MLMWKQGSTCLTVVCRVLQPGKGPLSARGAGPRIRQQPGRVQPLAIPVAAGAAAPPPQRILSPRRGTRDAVKPKPRHGKAEASGKPAAGQVSVMADGANPPVYPPMPAGAQNVPEVGVPHVDARATQQEASVPLTA